MQAEEIHAHDVSWSFKYMDLGPAQMADPWYYTFRVRKAFLVDAK